MEVIYKNYLPNKGFDEIQAFIYNEVVKPYNGNTVTAEQIKKRHENNKPDYNGIRFALKPDGTPLAYIQYYYYAYGNLNEKLYIGYPYAIEDCPTEIQEKLYSELLAYIKDKYPHEPIYMGYLDDKLTKIHQFAENKGFKIFDKQFEYAFDIGPLLNIKTKDYEYTIATPDNLELLVEVGRSDPQLNQLMSEENLRSYFMSKVLPDGHCVMLFKDNIVIAACAPLRNYRPGEILIRFTAIRQGHELSIKTLYQQLAKVCSQIGWSDEKLVLAVGNYQNPYLKELITEAKAKEYNSQTLFRLES